MAFLKVGGTPKQAKQRLYVMEITLPSGITIVKIGKSSGPNSTSRMMQIVESIYQKFRKTPMIYIKRDQEVPYDEVFKMETILHNFFINYQYDTPHKFTGSTECFVVPLADVVKSYDLVISGKVPDFEYELPQYEDNDKLPF